MALELNAAATVETTVVSEVSTDRSRIRYVAFDFSNTRCLGVVEFGTGEGEAFVAKSTEVWVLQGAFYENNFTAAPSGASTAEVLYAAVGGVVATVQGTPGLKDQLIASGELTLVKPQDAMRFFAL